ncbi:MAG: aspartate aminotransferase family protein [Bacteroidetes bacterium]|nr:aspartate aminotransferase family protein [Bacteroidota bacterium]
MKLFDVYPLMDVTPVRGEGAYLYDNAGTKYLDMYGGHAVISVGHSHPYYVEAIEKQLRQIGFYSNSVKIPIQVELAEKLGELSGYNDYHLFLCNSGAEANENALKLASFKNGRKKILSFRKSFHGRTSLAVAATDDKSICAPINASEEVVFLQWNNSEALQQSFSDDVCAVIIEGIQGVGGVHIPDAEFLTQLSKLCKQHGAVLILDEIQSGYGRSGQFFAHQFAAIQPDIITVAKGMGNGFPVAGVLIHPSFEARYGLLGTTFGGNHLACAAAVAVLDIIKEENLMQNASALGHYLIEQLKSIPQVKEVRGLGLMIGIEMNEPIAGLRNKMLQDYHIFTGTSSHKNVMRILPPLCINHSQADYFLESFSTTIKQIT